MKATTYFYDKLTILLLLFLFIGYTSCSDDEKTAIVKAEVTGFSPISGGAKTIITLKGTSFGTNPDNIKVTINGKETLIKTVADTEIITEVPKGASTGIIRVTVGKRPNAQVLICDTEFTYISNFVVSTYLGGDASGKLDGNFDVATLSKPRYLAWGSDDGLYIVEDGASGNSGTDYPSIRLAKGNEVSTILNVNSSPLVQRIRAIDFSSDMNMMYVANDNNSAGTMGFGTMVKSGNSYSNLADITNQKGVTCTKVHPKTGTVFVAYHTDAWIYQYDGSTLIPKVQLPSESGGIVDKANINSILFDKGGTTVYFVSRAKHVVYKGNYDITTGEFKNLEILAGSYGVSGYENGFGNKAKFNSPCQADIDEDGNVFVADRGNNCIRMITPEGEVSTFAGTNSAGMTNGIASQAEFNNPEGCQLGPDGALYIADYSNHLIRKIEEKAGEL